MVQDDFHRTFTIADEILFCGSEGIVCFLIAELCHFFFDREENTLRRVRVNESARVVTSDEFPRRANVFDGLVGASGHLRLVVDSVEALRVNGVVVVADFVENPEPVLSPFSDECVAQVVRLGQKFLAQVDEIARFAAASALLRPDLITENGMTSSDYEIRLFPAGGDDGSIDAAVGPVIGQIYGDLPEISSTFQRGKQRLGGGRQSSLKQRMTQW